MKYPVARVILSALLLAIGVTNSVNAASLEMRPTLVTDTLKSGEQKRAFVDVINPTGEKIIVSFDVQAFRQIDDNGALQFYDDTQIKQGIRLDLKEVELLGHEAVRMYYAIDSGRLPVGDVTAAIFATIKPNIEASAANAVRVGALLVVQNATAQRNAKITSLNASPLQIGSEITTSFAIKNTADSNVRSTFFPSVTIGTRPYGAQTVDGPLIAAGRERVIDYKKPGDYFGIMQINVKVAGDSKSTYVFAVTGYWRWLAPIILTVIAVATVLLRRFRKKSSISFN